MTAKLSEKIEYNIKYQKRKTLALHVLADASVEVRAPKWLAKREINHFVEARMQWIAEQREKILANLQGKPAYRQGDAYYYLGHKYPLHIVQGDRPSISFLDDQFQVTVKDVDDREQIKKLLERWYRQQGERLFTERLDACLKVMPEATPKPVLKLRRMRRRWGSCSSQQVVTLNTALITLPLQCIDYVIFHELCHLWEMNHSPFFYRLLATVMPDWKQREQLISRLSAEC